MDYVGLVRRYLGAAGVILMAFGVWDQSQADAVVGQGAAVVGGVMYLVDLAISTIGKFGAK